MEVRVIRSANRRKTTQARIVDGVIEVRIPARLSKADELAVVEDFRRRFARSVASEQVDLAPRARRLARELGLPRPKDIRWVSNQANRWGSCTPDTGEIRISDRLAGFPLWVLDHVITHELAHLAERSHNARFHALAGRYPLAERAEGFLLARADGDDPTAQALGNDLDDEHHDVRDPLPADHGTTADAARPTDARTAPVADPPRPPPPLRRPPRRVAPPPPESGEARPMGPGDDPPGTGPTPLPFPI